MLNTLMLAQKQLVRTLPGATPAPVDEDPATSMGVKR